MPRSPRITYPGALYHITSRGNQQQRIFRRVADRKHYLSLLVKYKKKFGFKLYTYALMPNHVHLMIMVSESEDATISKIMQALNTAYTVYFNKKYKQSGHLFQGRFHSKVVIKENYFWELSRYIHLNPVRANLIKKPEKWRWGSYRIYLNPKLDFYKIIDRDELLAYQLQDGIVDPREQLKRYREFVEEALKSKADVRFSKILEKA